MIFPAVPPGPRPPAQDSCSASTTAALGPTPPLPRLPPPPQPSWGWRRLRAKGHELALGSVFLATHPFSLQIGCKLLRAKHGLSTSLRRFFLDAYYAQEQRYSPRVTR